MNVVFELSLRGLIAMPAIRNTAGTDIIAMRPDGEWHASIQVKMSRNKVGFWPIRTNYGRWRGPHNHYAFVRYLPKEGRFEVSLESSERVVAVTDDRVAQDRARGCKDWALIRYLPNDATELARV